MQLTFNEILDILNKEVKQLKFDKKPHTLFDPIEYILSLGGKRVRPALSLMSYNLYKNDVDKIIPAALAIEIFHNFTLLHDDLMDRADMRRGKETVHIKWNDNIAVLSGDAMLIEAYKEMAKTDSKHLPEMLKIFSETATEICCGQQLDMEFEQRMDVTVNEYLEMITLKTAVLLACSLKEGALAADASREDCENLYNFGINIGLAFQLMDDLLDVYGNPETFGKKIGGDILCNKKTFLFIKALQSNRKKEMIEWVNKSNFISEDKIKAVTDIYTTQGIKEESEKLIMSYYEKGMAYLDKVSVEENKKSGLRSLAQILSSRNS